MGWRFIDQRPNAKVLFRDSLPFKWGLCLTLAAMEQLIAALFVNPEISFVSPRRFNQDCLENTFCQVRRDKGSFNDMLDTSRAVANLRAVAFSTFLSSITSPCSNSPDDGDILLIDCFRDLPPRIVKQRSSVAAAAAVPCQVETLDSSSGLSDSDDVDATPSAADAVSRMHMPHPPDEWHDSLDEAWLRIVSEEVSLLDKVQYVAGYLLQKASDNHCAFVQCDRCHDVLHASEYDQRAFMRRKTYDFAVRGLLTPSDQLLNAVRTWEGQFQVHFDRLLSGDNLLHQLQDMIPEMSFLPRCHGRDVRQFLTRTFFRLRIHHACRLRTRKLRDEARRASLRKLTKLGTPTVSKCPKRPA